MWQSRQCILFFLFLYIQENHNNVTAAEEFWIEGFPGISNLRIPVFCLFLINYVVTLSANATIVSLVFTSHLVHSPMYFFLSHLSLSDILLTTTIVPETLHIILRGGSAVSLPGCFTQFYFFAVSATTECLLLTVMSYDRYLAIYSPLRYSSIMDHRQCFLLVTLSWMLGVSMPVLNVHSLTKMSFCGLNIINHFFCELAPILKLSCSDTSVVTMGNRVLSFPLLFFPLVSITVSYINIFLAILRISSSTGRQKAFSTCSSHLTVVCIYYGTLVVNYMAPSKIFSLQRIFSVLYTMVTPLLNPIIYSLRNEEIKGTLMGFILKRRKRKL